MTGIIREISVFLCACFSGMVTALAYQMLLALRMAVSHTRLLENVEDFLYWSGVGIYLFYQAYCTTYGVIRWHFILGVVIGFVVVKYLAFRLRSVLWKIQKKLEKTGENK